MELKKVVQAAPPCDYQTARQTWSSDRMLLRRSEPSAVAVWWQPQGL